ncbi:unnamed protein product [Boreogadus saida]
MTVTINCAPTPCPHTDQYSNCADLAQQWGCGHTTVASWCPATCNDNNKETLEETVEEDVTASVRPKHKPKERNGLCQGALNGPEFIPEEGINRHPVVDSGRLRYRGKSWVEVQSFRFLVRCSDNAGRLIAVWGPRGGKGAINPTPVNYATEQTPRLDPWPASGLAPRVEATWCYNRQPPPPLENS